MANHQQIRLKAEAEKNKPLFLLGVIRIVNQQSVFIIEDSLCFFK